MAGDDNPFHAKAAKARADYERLVAPTASEKGIAQAFPLGGGFGHGSQKSRDRATDASIDRAVAAGEALKRATVAENQAAAHERAKTQPSREEIAAQHEGRVMSSVKVGDMVDVGGNAPLRVVKVNAKSLVTEGGSKFSPREVARVVPQAEKPSETKEGSIMARKGPEEIGRPQQQRIGRPMHGLPHQDAAQRQRIVDKEAAARASVGKDKPERSAREVLPVETPPRTAHSMEDLANQKTAAANQSGAPSDHDNTARQLRTAADKHGLAGDSKTADAYRARAQDHETAAARHKDAAVAHDRMEASVSSEAVKAAHAATEAAPDADKARTPEALKAHQDAMEAHMKAMDTPGADRGYHSNMVDQHGQDIRTIKGNMAAEDERRQRISHSMTAVHAERKQGELKEAHRATGMEAHFEQKAAGGGEAQAAPSMQTGPRGGQYHVGPGGTKVYGSSTDPRLGAVADKIRGKK